MSNSQLNLNFSEGSISLSFSGDAAKELQGALRELLTRLKAVASSPAGGSKRPTPQKPMEYQHRGEVFLEVFCNPNIWPSPFAAKILLTVRDERIRLTTEVELTQVLEDLERYLQQFGD
ncbi:hypothetical protein [Sodalinema gerasimenkoae]|uniref:hypothetical protein n=1 Tax=Sodalinema gerasimenkoae TaxID=2862348 RepID=UPI0013569F40|nr:hypothetical protein [Sodalinema gerasimenkoae]